MSSPEELAPAPTFVSISSSSYSPSSLESCTLGNEKLSIHQHVRRIPIRHRAWWLLSTMIGAGMLCAHLLWNMIPNADRQRSAEPLATLIAWDLGDSDATEIVLPENVRVVALVSYVSRSRTSILDCYLQSNLAINDGLLDQVVFTPETGLEEDLDWLYALVQSTPGYFMLGKPNKDISKDHVSVPIEDTQASEDSVSIGPFARAWNLALSTSQSEAPSPEQQTETGTILDPTTPSSDRDISTIYIFIHGETVFFAPEAISQLLKTHLTHPSYAFVQANMINQPVLSWIHHHLGAVRPYRPETELPYRLHRNNTAGKHATQADGANPHPWRASELPLWRDSHRPKQHPGHDGETAGYPTEQAQDFPPTEEPSLFNVPIDFRSPFRGHRWLPYRPHEHHPPSQPQAEDHLNRASEQIPAEDIPESISTPITQTMMSLQRPGKWPWTLSALHLYGFLEHLECTPPHSYTAARLPNTTDRRSEGTHRPNCTLVGGLDRYNMGQWEYQAERYGMSFFAIDSRTVNRIGVLRAGVSEGEILGRAGKGAVIDGGSIAVRFVGGSADDRVSEKRGLESTDLLRRFASVSREFPGCEVHDV